MPASISGSEKRQLRVRNNIKKRNRSSRSRVSIFRSNKNLYIQLIGVDGNVLHSCSSVVIDKEDLKNCKGIDVARMVGDKFAKSCVEKGLVDVVFDKGSYCYSGRVKAAAEACRKAGLKF
ncbi:MAG: large subunit ribosomal protein L18 [Rickettsiales bacterium]|jgi:large subunit ribosomal protein L18